MVYVGYMGHTLQGYARLERAKYGWGTSGLYRCDAWYMYMGWCTQGILDGYVAGTSGICENMGCIIVSWVAYDGLTPLTFRGNDCLDTQGTRNAYASVMLITTGLHVCNAGSCNNRTDGSWTGHAMITKGWWCHARFISVTRNQRSHWWMLECWRATQVLRRVHSMLFVRSSF